jgi:hypothetical protein
VTEGVQVVEVIDGTSLPLLDDLDDLDHLSRRPTSQPGIERRSL